MTKQKMTELLELHGYLAIMIGKGESFVIATDPETKEKVQFDFNQSHIDSLTEIFWHKFKRGILYS